MDDQRAERSLSDSGEGDGLDDSVDGWIARARKAHDLIDSVDLDAVAEHEPQAVARMDTVTEALRELAAGAAPEADLLAALGAADAAANPQTTAQRRPADAAGAAVEAPSDLDAAAAETGEALALAVDGRSAAALEALVLDGLSDRLGRLLLSDPNDPVLSAEGIPHRQGLPAFDFCVAPDRLPASGCYGLFVNHRCVFAALLPEPMADSRWRLLHTRPYEDEDGLPEAVRELLHP